MNIEDRCMMKGDQMLVCVTLVSWFWCAHSGLHCQSCSVWGFPCSSAASCGETAPLEESEGDEREGKTLVDISFVSQLFLALTMMCPLSPGIRTSPPRIACVKLIFAFECMSNPSRWNTSLSSTWGRDNDWMLTSPHPTSRRHKRILWV